MTRIKLTGAACAVAAIVALAPHATTGHASPDRAAAPHGLAVRVTARPANGGADCRVDFEFRNQNSYDVHIDWFDSRSKRRGLYTWRRMANLSTGDGWLVRRRSTRRTTKLIRQGCSTRRAYRIKVRGRRVHGTFYSGRLTKEFYWPPRQSGMVTYTRSNDLGPMNLDWDCTRTAQIQECSR